MKRGNYIPTPWPQKWRRFRYNVLPFLSFSLCLALTLWMWKRQTTMPNGIGEVEIRSVEVTALSAGTIAELTVEPHESVTQGEIIARLDSQLLIADINALREDIAKLVADIDAEKAAIFNNHIGDKVRHIAEAHSLALQVEQALVDLMDRRTLVLADKAELKRADARIRLLEGNQRVNKLSGEIADLEIEIARHQKEVVKVRLEQSKIAGKEALASKDEAIKRRDAYPSLLSPKIDEIIVSIQAAIKAQEKRIEVLELQINNLDIVAPMSGIVSLVHCTKGQNLQAGLPIVTITNNEPEYIVSYIRPEQKISPVVGMPVDVSLRSYGGLPVKSEISSIGPNHVQLPLNLLRDPTRPEFGLPVRIKLPAKLASLTPGEVVDVSFRWWEDPAVK